MRQLLALLVIILILGCNDTSSNNSYESQDASQYEMESNTGVYYEPAGLPISISFDKNGLGISFKASVVTPIGTFGISHTEKIRKAPRPYAVSLDNAISDYNQFSNRYSFVPQQTRYPVGRTVMLEKDDYLVLIKNTDGTFDLFRVETQSELYIETNGRVVIAFTNNSAVIDASSGSITNIKLVNMQPAESRTPNYHNNQTPTTNTGFDQATLNPKRNRQYHNQQLSPVDHSSKSFREKKKDLRRHKRNAIRDIKSNPSLTRKEKRRLKRETRKIHRLNKLRLRRQAN